VPRAARRTVRRCDFQKSASPPTARALQMGISARPVEQLSLSLHQLLRLAEAAMSTLGILYRFSAGAISRPATGLQRDRNATRAAHSGRAVWCRRPRMFTLNLRDTGRDVAATSAETRPEKESVDGGAVRPTSKREETDRRLQRDLSPGKEPNEKDRKHREQTDARRRARPERARVAGRRTRRGERRSQKRRSHHRVRL